MATLQRSLRKELEKTVKSARQVAEAGARKAVAQLGVGEVEGPKHLTAEQRALRNRLRAHGRQLGDRRDTKTGIQDTAHLVQECAYEQWHRLLFARFLAENDLLIEPNLGIATTLDEVRDLARDQATNWLELASDFAERMLPQIFRKDDPVLEIVLPPETRSEMEDLLKKLPRPVFEADDSLGWVYQFWQAEKKEEVNKSDTKIGMDELPAVTQLFTEDYMVLFLLHNTLGAWWAGKLIAANPELAISATDEAAVRAACKLGDIDWIYLRFVKDKNKDGSEGPWRPTAGVFEGWPKAAKDLTVLDPCMGSGHFLVFALPILVAFRMAEEGLDQCHAIDAVIRDNLFGLEIDPRCTQIAAFNLAFAAWRKIGHRPLPQLNLACSGLSPQSTLETWTKLAGDNLRLSAGMTVLHKLFSNAPILGSLVDPQAIESTLFIADFNELRPLLDLTLSNETDYTKRELAVAASGLAKATEILSQKFSLVITNVPYLSRNKQCSILQKFCNDYYARSITDLATVFVERSIKWLSSGGTAALVVPRIWMTYTAYYKSLRSHLLQTVTFDTVCHVGKGAFETISGEIVDVSLICLSNAFSAENEISLLNVSSEENATLKASALTSKSIKAYPQKHFLQAPGQAITNDISSSVTLLSEYANCYEGLSRGDTHRFDRYFWEIPSSLLGRWSPLINSSSCDTIFSGADVVFLWEGGKGALSKTDSARIQGEPAWGRQAIFVSRTHLHACLTEGFIHAQNGVAIVPKNPEDLLPILLFCRSTEYSNEIRKLNQKLIKPTGVMDKVPFDLEHWKNKTSQELQNKVPLASSTNPSQLYFDGQLMGTDFPLQVAVARLLGYRWPRQSGFQSPNTKAVLSKELEKHEVLEGIVCLPAIQGHVPCADRLIDLLRDAYGHDWSAAKLQSLLAQVGYGRSNLDDWLRNGFFKQHNSLFRQTPFIWHIWDGRRDGFAALVNYHKLASREGDGRRTLENLTYAYLGDWIDRQRRDQNAGVEGADARLAAASRLKLHLERILVGEPPYDLFCRWKPLSQQAIGWEPDIEDGVRVNIRPFTIAASGENSGASLLRVRPTINWNKSAGRETRGSCEEFPWLYGWDEQTTDWPGTSRLSGERHNNCHYSNEKKRSKREIIR